MSSTARTAMTSDLQLQSWEDWVEALATEFADTRKRTGFLSSAEEALEACPGNGAILLLAATAALLDEQPERAQTFLKRFAKRFEPTQPYHLLSALTLAQQNRHGAAQVLLKQHRLKDSFSALMAFPAGIERQEWLSKWHRAIMRPVCPAAPRHTDIRKCGKADPGPSKPSAVRRQAAARGSASAGLKTAVAAVDPQPQLPRIDVDIAFTTEFDSAPLLATLARPPESDGGWYGLRERFAYLGLAQGFDELLCLGHLRGIESFWYQIETVRKVLRQFRGRVLLADEVGLGKTIEAGMVLKEYLLRGMVESVLVLAPASLVGQWHEELETKFAIPCTTTQDALFRNDPDRFWREPCIVASIAAARRGEHARHLLGRNFDLVIVDEAHHLRDRSSQSYKLVDSLNKRFLLLLSATPVQNDLEELYNLLTLLKPGIFKTLKDFRAAYMKPGKPRQPANPERLRELMRGAMIRNTRAVVALKLPRRHAATIRVEPSQAERHCYGELAEAARRFVSAADGHGGRERLALMHLLGAAGSSPAAAAAALRRFAERRPESSDWAALAERWSLQHAGAKEAQLLDLLRRNPAEKKLVFVHYRETLEHLAGLLARENIAFARFDGSLAGTEKDAAIAAFRDHVPVLLSTESGGEGRNIQFCNTLINFDVPWNPMAIEQRIGRIDRIGQAREVFVFNLVSRGTLEEQVLALLDEKISMFELVVGEAGAILGSIEDDRDFSNLVLDA
ncbi:MAG TPA: SNF2-related protein, partial [Candidatus Baltobacteraceae bacterium]|nr:SNF2-related protein [Candidatus Baltobacteraceae bacterium]